MPPLEAWKIFEPSFPHTSFIDCRKQNPPLSCVLQKNSFDKTSVLFRETFIMCPLWWFLSCAEHKCHSSKNATFKFLEKMSIFYIMSSYTFFANNSCLPVVSSPFIRSKRTQIVVLVECSCNVASPKQRNLLIQWHFGPKVWDQHATKCLLVDLPCHASPRENCWRW